MYIWMYIYSKTSNNGPSEKRTNSIQRTKLMPPIDFPIDTEPLRADTSQLRTTDTDRIYLAVFEDMFEQS